MNKDLAIATLAHIKTYPFNWNQGEWRCRTGMCFAGWAVHVAGFTWANPKDVNSYIVKVPDTFEIPESWQRSGLTIIRDIDDPGYIGIDATYAAQVLLDIPVESPIGSPDEFSSGNSYTDLVDMCAERLDMTERQLEEAIEAYRKEHKLTDWFAQFYPADELVDAE